MDNKWIKATLETIIKSEKALAIIEEQLKSLAQSEDGDLWGTPEQVGKIVGILGLAYLDDDKFRDVMETECFTDDYTAGNIVVGIEHDDGTAFTEPIGGNFYIEAYKD